MKTRFLYSIAFLMLALSFSARADETITVTANDTDISAALDLKAVATLFGEAENLEDFERKLNDEQTHISNLDLNGDGEVDYIRVVETADGNKHLVLLQAVLAKDIFQDVASIYVEKDPTTQQVTTQVVGDEYIYGANYIVEPVYIYTPVIYDWFWGPYWTCWYSPWYWGYWPTWYHPYSCWLWHDYWHHIYGYHHYHHYCSFRHPREPRLGYRDMYAGSHNSRRDFASRHPESSFASRNAGVVAANGRAVSNARDLQPTRNATTLSRSAAGEQGSRTATTATSRGVVNDRTFGSQNIRVASRSGSTATPARGTSSTAATRTTTTTSTTRGTTATATRTSSATTSPSRSTSATITRSTPTATRTSSTTASPSRSTSATATRSTSTATRSSSSTATRSTASPSRTSSAPARTSTYSSGSSSRSGGYSSGSSSRSGGYSGGGSRGGGYSGGGGSRSGGSAPSGGGASRGGGRR